MQVQFLGLEDLLEEKGQPTPVFLPGETHGQRSLAGYRPWGQKESATTEHTHAHHVYSFLLPFLYLH